MGRDENESKEGRGTIGCLSSQVPNEAIGGECEMHRDEWGLNPAAMQQAINVLAGDGIKGNPPKCLVGQKGDGSSGLAPTRLFGEWDMHSTEEILFELICLKYWWKMR